MKFIVNEHTNLDYNKRPYKAMNYVLMKYCMDVALNKSKFSRDEFHHKIEVIEYMCELSNNISQISDLFRNESAHTNFTSSQERATICINWIIKVKQLLIRFMEKLDYESLRLW